MPVLFPFLCVVVVTLFPFFPQKRTRMSNEVYLRSHPELSTLLNDFVLHVLSQNPRPEAPEDIQALAVDFFTREGEERFQREQQQQQQQRSHK
jgi:hypothetical protein